MLKTQNRILQVLGSIYIICGLVSIYYIGPKAKNILIASLVFGAAGWIIAYLQEKQKVTPWFGLGLSFCAIIVFGQRCLANIMALIGIIQNRLNLNAYHKCITIVLLAIMCVASIAALIQYYSILDSKKN
jgi:carbon starvation protein CstA